MNRSRVALYVVELLVVVLTGTLLTRGQDTRSPQNDRSSTSCRGEDIIRFVDGALPLWSGPLREQTEWRACARIIEPSQPERRFCIAKEYDKSLHAEYAIAKGVSLHDQFCKLKEHNTAAAPDVLAAKASISKSEMHSSIALKQLSDDLEKLELPLALPNALVMDYPTYELEIHTQYGSAVRLELAGSPSTHPVVKWIRRTEALLNKNAEKPH